MARVAYQPCSDPKAQKNLQTTILNPVLLSDIEDLLSSDVKQKLESAYPDGRLFIWGLASTKTIKAWSELEPGDVAIFNTKTVVSVSACFLLRMNSRELALRLWGWEDESKATTWENIYFVRDVRHHAIDFKQVRAQLTYNRDREFFRYSASHSDAIFRLYPEISRQANSSGVALHTAKQEIQLEATEGSANVSTRLEHRYIVQHLFQGKETGYCCICHKEYPRHLLVAAHIKKRSVCTLEEKLDVENIALPMCRLGCDPLFEFGYLSVKNGIVTKHPSQKITAGIKEHLESVIGKTVLGWSRKNRKYFDWHMRSHGFSPDKLAYVEENPAVSSSTCPNPTTSAIAA